MIILLIIVVIVDVALIITLVRRVKKKNKIIKTGHRVSGKIIKIIVDKDAESSKVYRPLVKYTKKSGETVCFEHSDSYSNKYKVNQEVIVYYTETGDVLLHESGWLFNTIVFYIFIALFITSVLIYLALNIETGKVGKSGDWPA